MILSVIKARTARSSALPEAGMGRMTRKVVCLAVAVTIGSLMLAGCMLNTPEQVVKKFVRRLRGMRWAAMAELIDWPRSSQFVPGLPASNGGQDDAKKEVMLRIAENFTGFPVKKKTSEQIRHEFLYLKLARLKRTDEGENWAWLEVKLTLDSRAKEVQILVEKIDRVWRIALTDSVFK
jgi:hypothetical protein